MAAADPTYAPVVKIGLLGTISNLLSKEMTISRCSRCGADTDTPAAHTAWHQDLDRQIAAVSTDISAAMTGLDQRITAAATKAAKAEQDALAARFNMCPVCKVRVAAYNMADHLLFHVRRSLSDPVETPSAVSSEAGMTVP